MVTLPEPLPVDSDARAAGLEYITDITYKRLVALSERVEGAASRGLRVVSLAQSRFRTTETVEGELDLASSTLAAGLDDIRAVAAEVLLKEGVRLDAEWLEHEFGTVTVQVSGGVAVVVGKGLDVATAEKVFDLDPKPRVVVFLEDDLAGQDALKANLVANARSHGITVKTV